MAEYSNPVSTNPSPSSRRLVNSIMDNVSGMWATCQKLTSAADAAADDDNAACRAPANVCDVNLYWRPFVASALWRDDVMALVRQRLLSVVQISRL